MDDPVTDAAREWLTDIVEMYKGIDTGQGDPVHDALMKAQELLKAGPITRSDPFIVVGMLTDALPGDERAAALADSWTESYTRATRRARAAR